MQKLLLILLVAITIQTGFSQLTTSLDSLKFYGDAMFSLRSAEHRKFANEQFINLSKKLIITTKDTSLLAFHPSFLAVQTKDHLLKMITWQVELDHQQYIYYAFVFIGNNTPFLLQSKERNLDRINYELFTANNWYGALYYEFLPNKLDGYYTVLGYRLSKNGLKYRIIDLIKIESNTLTFGAPLFKTTDKQGEEDLLFRKVIAYSPSANMLIKFDDISRIIYFDHIEKYTDPKSGEILLVPDGTFESFELTEQFWIHNSYHQLEKLKTAPIEKPAIDSNNTDLFGRKKKSK